MLQGRPALATFTIKFTDNAGRKIYSIEVMNLSEVGGKVPGTVEKPSRATPTSDILNISHIANAFNNVSKVVDENGEPLVVYHGTLDSDFSVFDTNGKGKTSGTGAFFTSQKKIAETYSDTPKLVQAYEEDGKIYSESSTGHFPVYLNIRNPYIIDAKGKNWNNLGDVSIYNTDTGETLYEKEDGTPFYSIDDAWDYKLKHRLSYYNFSP